MMHTQSEIRRYDLFKLIVALVLLALIIILLLKGGQTPAAAPVTPEPAATEVAEGKVTEAATEESPAGAEIVPPVFELPDVETLAVGKPFTLRGTGTPGSVVRILVDGKPVGTAEVAADGSWSYPITLDEPGDHEITMEGLDEEGAVAATSGPLMLTLPSLSELSFALPEEEAAMLAGKETMLRGTGVPGGKVKVLVDGKEVGTADVAADGTWSFPYTFAKAGEYQFSLESFDAEGNSLGTSEPAQLMIGSALASPTFDLPEMGALKAGKEGILRGTGVPGGKVKVLVDGKEVGTADVAADGTWAFPYTFARAGEYRFSLESFDAEGNSLGSSDPVELVVGPALAAPTFDFPKAGAALERGVLEFRGTGTPGATLEILDKGKVVDKVVVGADGKWVYSLTPEVGAHVYSVRETGSMVESEAVEVTVSETAVAAEPGTSACKRPEGTCLGIEYIVVRGDSLFCISRCAGVKLGDVIKANPDIANPDLIYPAQVIKIPR